MCAQILVPTMTGLKISVPLLPAPSNGQHPFRNYTDLLMIIIIINVPLASFMLTNYTCTFTGHHHLPKRWSCSSVNSRCVPAKCCGPNGVRRPARPHPLHGPVLPTSPPPFVFCFFLLEFCFMLNVLVGSWDPWVYMRVVPDLAESRVRTLRSIGSTVLLVRMIERDD